jgi:hypothetical protein
MLAMNPTLLVGPADWNAARMPKAEFVARAGALWHDLPSATGVIVYGDRANHAELAYLTNFTPKLEAALALIPREGAPQLLVGGGVNMLPAARPLTFIEDLRPLRNLGKTVAEWARTQGGGAPVVIGSAFMPYGFYQEIAAALASGVKDKTVELRRLMGRKSARELAVLREASATLDATVAVMRAAQGAGAGATDAVLAGEQAANRRGAQTSAPCSASTAGARCGHSRPWSNARSIRCRSMSRCASLAIRQKALPFSQPLPNRSQSVRAMSCEAPSPGCKPASAAARLRAALRRPAIPPTPSRRASRVTRSVWRSRSIR